MNFTAVARDEPDKVQSYAQGITTLYRLFFQYDTAACMHACMKADNPGSKLGHIWSTYEAPCMYFPARSIGSLTTSFTLFG